MADYTKNTGSTGVMMIRVTSTTVEFWLKVSSYTWSGRMPWRYTINGTTSSWRYEDFHGTGSYQKLGGWTVSSSQTVKFEIGDTGTLGLAGPTSFSVSVDRGSAPPKPPAWQVENIQDDRVTGDVDGYGNGGHAIDRIQIRYDDSSTAASPLYKDANSYGGATITGLSRGKTYYFWVRTHNVKGWSPWSNRSQATTHNVPARPATPTITNVTQNSFRVAFTANGDGGSPITTYQIGYGKDPNTPSTIVNARTTDLKNLSAGDRYYVWSRVTNKYGNSSWSLRATVLLLAGAWVDVNGVKKRAVPYVRYNGVWRVAQVKTKLFGFWADTS